jgi:hypothetical protein
MALVPFVQNHDDLSTDRGYQFKFYCDKCGNGYMSRLPRLRRGDGRQPAAGRGRHVRGVFGQAGNSAYEIQRAVAGKAHDDALEEAVLEVKPHFTQCVRCGRWVCNEVCWNPDRGLCSSCAPQTEEEIAAAQAEAQVEQIREKVRAKDQTKDLDLDRKMVARCPHVQGPDLGRQFCPECGATLAPKDQCGQCNAKMAPSAKFCPECGAKRS